MKVTLLLFLFIIRFIFGFTFNVSITDSVIIIHCPTSAVCLLSENIKEIHIPFSNKFLIKFNFIFG